MSNKIVILLKGSNCAPCKQFEPVFDEAADASGLTVCKYTDDVEMMQRFGVRQVPVVVLVDEVNGRLEAHHLLAGSNLRKAALVQAIEDFKNYEGD